jgi:hypothetical protein
VNDATPTLVFLIGPPAVGKMTVGAALARRTGLPLYHNHLSIESVLPVFEYGTPAFGRLVGLQRREMFREVARSSLPGLIFTFVWAFNEPEDSEYVRELTGIFEAEGGRTVYVELWADLETRLSRNESESRLAAKASKRDVEASRARLLSADERWQTFSDGAFPLSPHLFIDTSAARPTEVAERIADHFDLPAVRPASP